MITDAVTVGMKELREILTRGGTTRGRRAVVGNVIRPALIGLILGFGATRRPVGAGIAVFPVAFFAMGTAAALVADTVAGERERHTLETLLASPASDESILAGKLAAVVGYAWAVALVELAAIALGSSLHRGPYPIKPWTMAVVGALSLLEAGLSAGLGVQFSLRAATVRAAARSQAQANIVLSMLAGAVNFSVGDPRLSQPVLVVAGVAALVLADTALLAYARRSFRRSRLLLD